MKKIYILFLIIFILIIYNSTLFANYRPEISGDFEIGDRLYTDLNEEEEEILDQYWYRRYWLKYKQKLTASDYYYIKGQYYQKEYKESSSYDNISLDFWINYTYEVNEKTKNKWLLSYRDKNYYKNVSNSYYLYRIKYQVDYKYDKDNKYTIYLQRQWKDFTYQRNKNNIYDRLSLTWDYQVTEDFDLNSNIQFDREIYNNISDSSNKFGKRLSIGFKWNL